jgi:hypothetical protein
VPTQKCRAIRQTSTIQLAISLTTCDGLLGKFTNDFVERVLKLKQTSTSFSKSHAPCDSAMFADSLFRSDLDPYHCHPCNDNFPEFLTV